ncbi:MAG: hypothetical protein PVS2B3_03490 [Steroidobacteraceae bacterium]
MKDLKGASRFLALLSADADVKKVTRALVNAPTFHAPAKDLLRASTLPLLPRDESHVQQDLKRIRRGKRLSPVLLVRGDLSRGVPLAIADGYHRICAIFYFDEDAPVACRLAAALHR